MADDPSAAGETPEESEPIDADSPSNESNADSPGEFAFSQADIDAALNPTSPAEESAGDAGAAPEAESGSAKEESQQTPPEEPPQAAAQEEGAAAEASSDAGPTDADALAAELLADQGISEEPEKPAEESRTDASGNPFDAAAAEMAAAIAEEAAAGGGETPSTDAEQPASTLELPDFSNDRNSGDGYDITLLNDVNLRVHIELGRTWMYVEDVLKLSEGSVVELDSLAGDPVDIFVNDRLIARGEVLVLNDNFCVRISEIVSSLEDVAVA